VVEGLLVSLLARRHPRIDSANSGKRGLLTGDFLLDAGAGLDRPFAGADIDAAADRQYNPQADPTGQSPKMPISLRPGHDNPLGRRSAGGQARITDQIKTRSSASAVSRAGLRAWWAAVGVTGKKVPSTLNDP